MKFAQFLLILAVAADVNSQFFDFFSAFKPQTLRPIFEPTKSPRIRTHATERYQDIGRRTTEHTTKLIRKTTKTNKQTNKKSKIDKIIDDGRNTINYDSPRTKAFTENPFVRPGINPAVVNGPPITNKPPRQYVPRPIAGLDQNDDGSVTPELVIGPDEDYMTSVEKQRYIDMAEKKCEQYMALTTVRVEAIPLVPSPRPVVINVSSCAWSVPLVVGGSVVTIQQFPHMALLGWTRVQSGGYSWKCGGSLVSERHVLTAAHCAYQERDDSVIIGPPRVVQLGSSRLDDPGAIVQRVSSVTRHPKYHPPQSYHDIAVVTMTSAVTFSPAIRPACMGAPPAPGEHFIATGWGKTEFGGEQSNQLRGVSLSVWSREECGAALGNTRKLPRGPDSSQTCAGERNGGKDTCQGDSGGPAQVLSDCSWRVLAVTSAGRACGAPDTPALYANVPMAFVAKVVFGQSHVDEHNRPNSNNQQNSNSRPNSNSNSRPNSYNNQNSNSHSRPTSNNNQNSNSNSRPNSYNNQNSNSHSRPTSNNNQNSNSHSRPNSYNNQNSYSSQNSNSRPNDYNRENSNNQQPISNSRENNYNRPNSNSQQSSYNNQNSNNQQSGYSDQNSNSNSRPNSNSQQNSYNNQNSNNNYQQSQWNRRTTTAPKWKQNQSYDERDNDYYDPTYIYNTDGRRRGTDERSTSRPQYYSSLDRPYGDGSVWMT